MQWLPTPFLSPSVNVRAQARVGYTCVYVYHFYACVYPISSVWVVHMRYIIYMLCAYLRRGGERLQTVKIYCTVKLAKIMTTVRKKNYTGKIWVWWKNSLMSGFQFNPRLSSKNQMNKVYHTPQVCLSALVIIFYFILSSCMYLQDSVLTFPPSKCTHSLLRAVAKYICKTVQPCVCLFIRHLYQSQ